MPGLSLLAWRSLASRPLRTLLTLLAVALGVAMLVAVATTNATIDASLQEAARRLIGNVDAEVRSFGDAGFTRQTAETIARLPEILQALRQSHPYEEPAFDLVQLAAPLEKLGQGRIGNLPATALPVLLTKIKQELHVNADQIDFLPFKDLEQSVRDDVTTIKSSPLIPDSVEVSGFIYDVRSGKLLPVV